jgi:acetylornithine deacetylase
VFDGSWGEPFLLGPGSIHVAHTANEHIAKKDLLDAVNIYAQMVRQLLAGGTA